MYFRLVEKTHILTSLQFTIRSCLVHYSTVPENDYILMEKVLYKDYGIFCSFFD